jgi:hypothetical protein
MITLVFGVPGSGKTFWAVHTIRKKILQESDIFFRVRDDCLLITNLRLRLDSQDNYIFIENWEDWFQFFNVNFWQQNINWWSGKKVWLIMDECQRFFMIAKENPEVWFYLQYHRHLSHNLIFITQTPKSIPGKLYELCEFIIESVPRSINIFSVAGFRYRVLSPLDKSLVLRRFHIPYDSITFYLYNDMIYKDDEGMKPQNAFIKPLATVGLSVLGVVLAVHVFFSGLGPKIQLTQAQPTPTQSTAQPITYEDLITEGPIRDPQPKEPKPEAPELKPKEEPTDYYHITVEKTRPKMEEIDLTGGGPKVIYLP